jgi:branched-chain amino acid transport system substrate-binding protein
MNNGIQAAVELYAKENSSLKIKLKQYSHGEDIESIMLAANQIVADKVDLVIGGEMSVDSLVLGKVFNERKIVFITPTSTNPDVTRDRPYVFRTCFSDDQVAESLARYVSKNMSISNLGVLHNVSSPYSNFLTENFVSNIKKLMPSLNVVHEKIVSKQINFKEIVQKFKVNGVTHVAMLTYLSDLVMFYSDATAGNFYPTYIGSDGWGSSKGILEKLTIRFNKKFTGYRNTYWSGVPKTNFDKEFVSFYEKRFSSPPDAWSAVGFDTGWIALTALSNVKNGKRSIRDALYEIHDLPLVTSGSFKFLKNNSPSKELFVEKLTSEGIQAQGAAK